MKHKASEGTKALVSAAWATVVGSGLIYAFLMFFPHLNEGGLSVAEMVFMGGGIVFGAALAFPSRAKAALMDVVEGWKKARK